MLAHKLVRLDLRLLKHAVRLCLGVCQDGVLVGDTLLVALDLVRRLHAEFPQKLIDLILVYNDLCR